MSLQFNDLIGKHIVQEKRLIEIAPDFVPINPTVKVKVSAKEKYFISIEYSVSNSSKTIMSIKHTTCFLL